MAYIYLSIVEFLLLIKICSEQPSKLYINLKTARAIWCNKSKVLGTEYKLVTKSVRTAVEG